MGFYPLTYGLKYIGILVNSYSLTHGLPILKFGAVEENSRQNVNIKFQNQ